MFKITEVYEGELPDVCLIGKKYDEKDIVGKNFFSEKLCDWFYNDWFDGLRGLNRAEGYENTYVTGYRKFHGDLEFWIGVFCKQGTLTPSDYDGADVNGGKFGIACIKAREEDVYNKNEEAETALLDKQISADSNNWRFEFYTERFMEPDDDDEVVLDYCFFKKE